MSILTQLITDRTSNDVQEWLRLRAKGYAAMTDDEKRVWIAGMKGSYNASDLNRITSAMVYLANLYRQFGYSVTYSPLEITHADGTVDTTWRLTDIPTEAQLLEILRGISSLWAAVERAEANVLQVWDNSGFGYLDFGAPVVVGDYAEMLEAHGLKTLTATVRSAQLASITVAGTGWAVSASTDSITATCSIPLSAYEDIQNALDALVFVCNPSGGSDFADATVSLSATLRSGATVNLGAGSVSWSAIINWAAFEAYAFTWEEVEAAELTWEELESLPTPKIGGEVV